MATIKSYTSVEQSKVLAEFLPHESADMCYCNDGNASEIAAISYEDASQLWGDFYDEIIPCWSLAALMNILPSEFTEKGKYSTTTYKIEIRKYKFTDEVDLHQIAYGSYKWHEDGGYTWSDMINTGEKENLIDAAFEMVYWLKENKKI